jgi:hypothetical protein
MPGLGSLGCIATRQDCKMLDSNSIIRCVVCTVATQDPSSLHCFAGKCLTACTSCNTQGFTLLWLVSGLCGTRWWQICLKHFLCTLSPLKSAPGSCYRAGLPAAASRCRGIFCLVTQHCLLYQLHRSPTIMHDPSHAFRKTANHALCLLSNDTHCRPLERLN